MKQTRKPYLFDRIDYLFKRLTKKSFRVVDLAVYILLILHMLANIYWISVDSAPPTWDESGHLLISYDYLDYFNGDISRPALEISSYYPPLTHTVIGISFSIFGESIVLARVLISVLFVITVYLFYKLLERVKIKGIMALLLTILFSLSPMLYQHSRILMLEVPMLFTVIFSLNVILSEKFLANKRSAILLGISIAMMLMTKWTTTFFVAPILLGKLFGQKINSKQLSMMTLSLVTAVTLSLPWYLTNLAALVNDVGIYSTPEAVDPTGLTIENLVYYAAALIHSQILWPLVFLLLIATFFVVTKQKREAYIWVFGFLAIYAAFTIIGNKNYRYTLPIIVYALVIIGQFASMYIGRQRHLIYAGLIFSVLVSYNFFFVQTFTLNSSITSGSFFHIPIRGINGAQLIYKEHYNPITSQDSRDWKLNEMIMTMFDNKKGDVSVILVNIDKARIHASSFRIGTRIIGFDNLYYDHMSVIGDSDLDQQMMKYEFVVLPEKSFGAMTNESRGDNDVSEDVIRDLEQNYKVRDFVQKSDRYRLVDSYKLPYPDGDTVHIYQSTI